MKGRGRESCREDEGGGGVDGRAKGRGREMTVMRRRVQEGKDQKKARAGGGERREDGERGQSKDDMHMNKKGLKMTEFLFILLLQFLIPNTCSSLDGLKHLMLLLEAICLVSIMQCLV